ncbi:hypothetical protein [Streptomyces sp. NPDC054834]
MAGSEALFGLVGVVGGALITGVTAIYAPLFQHRRERIDSETQMARKKEEEETASLIKLRILSRTWRDLLARSIVDLQAGRTVDADRLDEQTSSLDREAMEAHYLGAADAHAFYTVRGGVFVELRRTTEAVRRCALEQGNSSGSTANPIGLDNLSTYLERLDRARGYFNDELAQRLVHMAMERYGGPPA